ncbi:esterase-like activity of phytase family protein [soil metagenome]
MVKTAKPKVRRLKWRDMPLDEIRLPGGVLRLTFGPGSGLARRAGDPPGVVWAIGDRGPNLKVAPAMALYGLTGLAHLADREGAKIMPRPDIGPTLSQLRIEDGQVELLRSLVITLPSGRAMSGLPLPGGDTEAMEPVFDLAGEPLGVDPGGADSEGVVALANGGFIIADEYGPSLIRLNAEGVVVARWIPAGLEVALAGAGYPALPVLPAIALARRLNRGFEAIALSADETWLYVAFQSALEVPTGAVRSSRRITRIWKLDALTGAVAGQYAYPFDEPASFRRDAEAGPVSRSDLKVCELVWVGPDQLLVLERITRSAKIYRIDLAGMALPPEHLLAGHRPWLEEMTGAERKAAGLRPLAKTLMFSTDDAPKVCADLEGMALLEDGGLILVNDNDFGVEGAQTRFYRVDFKPPL